MRTPSWQQVFTIFEEAAELPGDERAAFLDQACDDDGALREAVEGLLAAEQREDEFLDQPLVGATWRNGALGAPPDGGPGGAEERPEPAPGTPGHQPAPIVLGAYRLLRQIGQGGMSTVYLAVRDDDAFQRRVVVKLVRRGMESAAILRRLRAERQILASLDHPYISQLFDGGSTREGLPYFVMEHVDGVPIDAYCEHNHLSLDERLQLFRKVCEAVQYAHQNLIVHRDIKPSNILVTADGDPKLLDFGIAKLLNPDLAAADSEPTATWQRVMTPSYASPEQVRGKHITTASDVYSLGVLLYKLLTGRLPRSFQGRSQREIEQLLTDTDPLPPSVAVEASAGGSQSAQEPSANAEQIRGFRKELSGDLDAIVLKALRSAPAQRYGSASRLAEDIERYQDGQPVAARAGTWRYRAGKFVRRHRTGVAVATTMAVLLTAFVGAMIWQSARVARERDQARLERDQKQQVLTLVREIFEVANPYVQPGDELTVREALARSVPVLEAGLKGQPDVRAELLHTSGTILTVLGVYDTAIAQLEEALELSRRLHGDRHGDVVLGLRALASVRKRGRDRDLDQAEALAQEAVAIARELEPEPGPLVTGALTELVSVLCYRRDYELAEAPAQEALELARTLPEADVYGTATLGFLAIIHSNRGDYREAADLYRQALAKLRKRYGERHPIQTNTLNNLGLALRRQEEFEAAEAAYQELIDLQRENFGDDYRDPDTLANLAGARFGRGDYASAEELYRQARDQVIELADSDHWLVYLFELGAQRARLRNGQAAAAAEDLRRLLATWTPKLGADHRRILQGRGALGESLSVIGRCQEAEPLLVESFERLLEEGRHRHKQDAFESLRDHLERCGRQQEIAGYEALLSSSTS